MKIVLIIFAIATGMVMVSCSPSQEKIINPSDYQKCIVPTGTIAPQADILASIDFWSNRFEKNGRDVTSLLKMASHYARLFKVTGDIGDLIFSDSLYQKVLRESAFNHTEIYQNLAANAISRHEFWLAKKHILQALEEGENRSTSLFILTDVLLELGNLDSAKQILSGFTNKNNFAWLIRHAKVLDSDGDLDSAILAMEKAHSMVKANKELYCWSKSNLADMYGHAGRIQESYQAYLAVLQKDPGYDYALKGIAWIAFSHDHNTTEASRILKYLSGRKQSPDYYLTMAEIERFNKNIKDAHNYEKTFRKLIASPSHGNMYNRHLIEMTAESPEAISLAQKEISVRPTAESYNMLAWAFYQNNRIDEAVTIAENFVEQSHEPEALYRLGMIFQDSDQDKARTYLEQALESSFELGPVKKHKIELALRNF